METLGHGCSDRSIVLSRTSTGRPGTLSTDGGHYVEHDYPERDTSDASEQGTVEARRGAHVLGVDIARNLVEAGNRRAQAENLTRHRTAKRRIFSRSSTRSSSARTG